MSENQTAKEIGRAASYELQSAAEARGEPLAWFDELYRDADGNRERIPWSAAAPRDHLRAWLEKNPGNGRSAIDVGCGLGDNAALIAEAGYSVTAFDISQVAVDWATKTHTDKIRFQQADLFNLPAKWHHTYDLVHETYNLQALPPATVHDATRHISSLVAPGGTALIITRTSEPGDEIEGPPWPLNRDQLAGFEEAGLTNVHEEKFVHGNTRVVPHLLIQFER